MIQPALYSSASDDWSTPESFLELLAEEFDVMRDPCPIGGSGGLERDWLNELGETIFVNPPYSDITSWLDKCLLEASRGCTVLLLVPSRTDTRWFTKAFNCATQVRFIKGRLAFGGKGPAPFPSVLFVFTNTDEDKSVFMMERE